MARTVLTPLRINAHGGVSMTPQSDGGRRSLLQVIVARLTPGATEHPFDLADGLVVPGGLYDTASARAQHEIQEHVRQTFGVLEGQQRAKLSGFELGPVRNDGRRQMNVSFVNLELTAETAATDVEL